MANQKEVKFWSNEVRPTLFGLFVAVVSISVILLTVAQFSPYL